MMTSIENMRKQQEEKKTNLKISLEKLTVQKAAIESDIEKYESIIKDNEKKTTEEIKKELEDDRLYYKSAKEVETDEEIRATLAESEAETEEKIKILAGHGNLKRRHTTIVKTIAKATQNLEDNKSMVVHRSDLSEDHLQLLKLRAETAYHLPEALGGTLISSEGVISVLKSVGVETNNIDKEQFFNLVMSTLELPVPFMPEPKNEEKGLTLSQRYIRQIDNLVSRYRLRIGEACIGFRMFSGMENFGKNPRQEEEKELASSLMKTSIQDVSTVEALSKDREAVLTIFRNHKLDSNEAELEDLINKAISHPFELFQAICVGLTTYEGFSFHVNSVSAPHYIAMQKSMQKTGSGYDVTHEFYRTRNGLVRNYFNLKVLEFIHRNFENSISEKG